MAIRKGLYIALGALCVALGTLGIALPGLPTTPFLLAASWLFYRSSPRLQEWLLSSPLGRYVRTYHRIGGMHRTTKLLVVFFMCAMVVCSIIFFIPNTLGDYIVGIAGALGSAVVIFLVPDAKRE